MKFRLTLGLLAIVAGLVFGFSALPGQAHAATAVTLTAEDRSNIQSVLDLTKVTLDSIQVQIDRDAIQDRAATLATLGNIRVYLLNMRELLGGAPASSAILIEEPEPVATAPRVQGPAPAAPQVPAEPAAPVVPEPSGEVAGSAMVNETAPQNQQTASVSSSATSKRAFWIILITAIVIATILAIPRKKTVVLQETAQKPQPPNPEDPGPVQSA